MNTAVTHQNITIRPAHASDQTAITSLVRTVGINPLGLNWPHFLVAVDQDDRLIGCGQIKRHRDGSFELASIAVQRSWRNQGIAADMIRRLQAQQGPPLWLTCVSTLVPFYQPFGFVEITDLAQMPTYFRRIKRLFPLFRRLTWQDVELSVMGWR